MAVTITSIRAMSASLQVRYVVPPMYSSSHYTHTSTVRYIVRVPFRSIEAELCVCVRGNTRLVVLGMKNYIGQNKIWDSNLIAYPDGAISQNRSGMPCVWTSMNMAGNVSLRPCAKGGPKPMCHNREVYTNNTCKRTAPSLLPLHLCSSAPLHLCSSAPLLLSMHLGVPVVTS